MRIFLILAPCGGCNMVCDTIYSRDMHLFRIMKKQTTEAPNYRNTAPFRFSPSFSFWSVDGRFPASYRLAACPAHDFFKIFCTCADSHRFCGPIHSEDTNLFQFMKKPVTAKTSFPLLPSVSLPVVPGSLGPLVPYVHSLLCSASGL